ncbi:1-acyl-sn-glycerol-3-phosphate acyltransferase [Terracoccus luteus]|uniref:1-acyl-sn-glycerol-3-phosphate acyltransferase n=1 Tax=Terracoccus luteus TaxID=53356 RepID=A0A495XZA1_9MICO|nr:lysophospholipid acyltransferase family protein [Terracoccus luteus]RKT77068.1 1-acyl-sn-glycerol-3-phosphate acyltransferase [Terracoccus luteus]
MEPLYSSVVAFAGGVFAMQRLRFTIVGAQNLPRTGGAVVAVNHISYFDFAYAGWAARASGRHIRFLAKEAVFRHPVGGPLMRGMRHIPVDREAGAASYDAAVAALRAGEVVGVFPEATTSRSFELKEFKLGVARMAAEAGVPIVPLVVWGSQRVWSKGLPRRLGPSRLPVTVIVGEPVHVAPEEDPAAVTRRYRAVMAEQLETAQRGYEPLSGPDLRYLPARLGGTAPTLEEAGRIEEVEAARRRRDRERRLGREGGAG